MSKLKQKFKRILKSDHAKMRDICIFTAAYFQEVRFPVDMSPMKIKEVSTPEQIRHNFFLARAYFGKRYGIRLNRKNTSRPEHPRKPQYWTSYDWEVFHYDPKGASWVQLTAPLFPGKDIFERNDQITTEDLINQLNTIDAQKEAEEGH